jgi:hypothetical protein
MVVGTVIAESIRVGSDLSIPINALQRVPIANAVAGQPSVWTMCQVICPDEDADALATALAEALEPGPWYADLRGSEIRYVVFSGHVFRHTRSETSVRDEARAYGQSVGVPTDQLDWA